MLYEVITLMAREGRDYHATFRGLGELELAAAGCRLRDEFADREGFDAWLGRYRLRLRQDGPA